jgi:hypothetical protein
MSNINVIGVIGALFIAACFFLHHVLITFNRKNIEIVTGVAQGIPTPQDMRWRTLMLVQVTSIGFAGAFALLMALCFRAIGDNVVDADVRFLAQVCAWIYVSLSALLLIAGPATITSTASVLRKSERD